MTGTEGDPGGDRDEDLDLMLPTMMGADVPRPVDWSALSAEQWRDELHRLWRWVVEMALTWPIQRQTVPPCWYRHESLVRILSAARDAYLTSYHPTQPASAAADWMHVWDATVERLTRWSAGTGCKSGEHQADRFQRWVADANEFAAVRAAFERFVDDNVQRRSTTA